MTDTAEQRPTFSFAGIATRRLVLEERTDVPVVAGRPPANVRVKVKMNLGADIRIMSDRRAGEVLLRLRLEPDPTLQPVFVEVVLSALFRVSEPLEADRIRRFCAVNGIPIMWPYVREVVSRITSDAYHGQIRLDPVNLTPLIQQILSSPIAEPQAEVTSAQVAVGKKKARRNAPNGQKVN